MAQAKWIYDDLNLCKYALYNWIGVSDITADSYSELMEQLSSTKNQSVYDNEIHAEDDKQIIIAPFTDEQFITTRGYSGVMIREYTSDETSYSAPIHSLYTQRSLSSVIDACITASGLETTNDLAPSGVPYSAWYRDLIKSRLNATNSYVNDCVKRTGAGILTEYVDKQIVKNILDIMAGIGMFDYETSQKWGEVQNIEDIQTFNTASEVRNALNKLTIKASASDEQIQNAINTLSSLKPNAQFIYVFVQGTTSTIQRTTLTISAGDIPDISNYDKVQIRKIAGSEVNYALYGHQISNEQWVKIDQFNCDTVELQSNGSIRTTTTRQGLYPTGTSYFINLPVIEQFSETAQIYRNTLAGCEAGRIYPDGIIALDGAILPESGTRDIDINAIWSEWATTTVPCIRLIPSFYFGEELTYIALGNKYTTQDGAQSGIVTELGLVEISSKIKDIENYPPIIGDDPIIPDPNPIPIPLPPNPVPHPSYGAGAFYNVFMLTETQLQNVSSEFWSSNCLNELKEFFSDPMSAIFGLSLYTTAGIIPQAVSKRMFFGTYNSGLVEPALIQRKGTETIGTLSIPEYYQNVEDYAPYTTAEIYLPLIGFRALHINDIMGKTVTLKYDYDFYTGECIARLYTDNTAGQAQGIIGEWSGMASSILPITNRDNSAIWSAQISGIASIASSIISANPLGAVNAVIGDIQNTAQASRQSVKTSGSIGGGVLFYPQAFIKLKRPKAYNASTYPAYYGQPSWWTCKLGSCKGYTKVSYAHLDGFNATQEEKNEIMTLLESGVIF